MKALLYLLAWTFVNRFRAQARRLRKPKYLVAAVAGLAYFWFFLLRGLWSNRPPSGNAAEAAWWLGAENRLLLESVGALLLLGTVVLNWLLPSRRAALEFSEAEVAMLFPAPVSRLTLINYRLLRSQPALIFTGVMMTLFSRQMVPSELAWAHAFGWWALFTALEFHRLGAAFVRTRWLDRGITPARRRLGVLAALMGVLAAASVWGWNAYPPLTNDIRAEPERLIEYLRAVAGAGPVFWVLLPFRILFRPLLAADSGSFWLATVPAAGLLAVLYVWVIRSRVAFEEASIELSRQRARAMKSAQKGNWHLAPAEAKPRRAPFHLAAEGPRWVAYLWKNLIAGRVLSSNRALLVMGVAIALPVTVITLTDSQGKGLWVLGPLCIGLLMATLFAGPLLLLFDLRQDLPLADVLKTHPIPAWQMVAGQVAAPALVMWAAQTVLLTVAVVAFGSAPERIAEALPLLHRVALALTGIMLLPGINLISLTLLNGAAITFPSWVRFDPERARSFETMGQYMLVTVGQTLLLGFALIPAGLVFAVSFLAGRLFLPFALLAPLCGVVTALVLAAEAAAVIRWVGDRFDRLDLSEELIPAGPS